MGSLLGNRNYRHLFAAQVVALFGTGLTTVALGLLAYDLAGARAGVVLGTAFALKMVVYVLLAPIAGAYADQLPRRGFLVALDLARAAVVLALPFVDAVWQVYALIVVLQAASAAFTPTFQATLPDVLPKESDYTRALSASQLAASLETLLSPVLAAAVLSVVTFHWLFTGTTVGFLLSAALVLTSRIPLARRNSRQNVVGRLTAGIHIFLATPRLRAIMALNLAVAGAGAMIMVNTVNYSRDVLGGNESDVALLFAANGVGTILVALVLPRILGRIADRVVLLGGGALLCTGILGAVALSGAHAGQWRWGGALLVWAVAGMGSGLVLTPIGRVLRRSARDTDRPAVFAAQFSLSHACWLLSYPVAGLLVTTAGYAIGWTVLAGLTVLGAALAVGLWPRRDEQVLDHVHHDLPAGHAHLAGAEATPDGGWRHAHRFVIDAEHRRWPQPCRGSMAV